MTTAFTLRLAPMRLRFGTDAAVAVAEELASMGLIRAVVLSTSGHEPAARAFAAAIGRSVAGVVALARMHTPVEVTAVAMTRITDLRADGLSA